MDMCRHCNAWKVSRPRGLCKRCYYTPGLKDCYPRLGGGGGGWDQFCGERVSPQSTPALPGTPEKVAVMCERASNGQALFHPRDADWDMALTLED